MTSTLRAVTSTDGVTADFYQFDMTFLGETATRIINEVILRCRARSDQNHSAGSDPRGRAGVSQRIEMSSMRTGGRTR